MSRKKRANGAGSIEELPSGKARIVISVHGKRKRKTFANAQAAQEELDALDAVRARGLVERPESLTLAAFGPDWLDARELRGSASRAEVRSIGDERSRYRQHIATSALAAMPLRSIRPLDVEAFARWLRGRRAYEAIGRGQRRSRPPLERTIAVRTQRHVLGLLNQMLKEAVVRGLISTNPAQHVRIAERSQSTTTARRFDEDWLRAEEIDQLLACEAISSRDRTFFAAAIGTALRLNDLKGLRVADVHLDAQVPGPHVQAFIRKSEKWHRVPILPWLDPWLRAHLATLPRDAVYLFPTASGTYYRRDHTFAWGAKRLAARVRPSVLERAGIERRIRFHDLRGTTATHLALGTWGRRWALHEVQGMLAHADQRVTERYVRRAVDTLAAAAAATTGGPGMPVSHAFPTAAATMRNDSTASRCGAP